MFVETCFQEIEPVLKEAIEVFSTNSDIQTVKDIIQVLKDTQTANEVQVHRYRNKVVETKEKIEELKKQSVEFTEADEHAQKLSNLERKKYSVAKSTITHENHIETLENNLAKLKTQSDILEQISNELTAIDKLIVTLSHEKNFSSFDVTTHSGYKSLCQRVETLRNKLLSVESYSRCDLDVLDLIKDRLLPSNL
eukprot:Sdes_comp20981_c1_seq1m19308